MRKTPHFFLTVGIGLFCLMSAGLVYAQEQPLQVDPYEGTVHIRSFHADIDINLDGSMNVTEKIVYDFVNEETHGIMRHIPYFIVDEEEEKRYMMSIEDIQVSDASGNPYPFEQKRNGELLLQIGNADKTVTGVQTYLVSYQIGGAFTYHESHDELFWEVTGTEWQDPISSVMARVSLPDGVDAAKLRYRCFTGNKTQEIQNCTITQQGTDLMFEAHDPLLKNQGMVVLISWNKGVVAERMPEEDPSYAQKRLIGKITMYGFIAGIFLWYVVYPIWIPIRWVLYGRDPHVGNPPTVWYDPPQTKNGRFLTPAEVGTLIDERVHPRDISATLVDLARRGFFHITQKEKSTFFFEKKKDYRQDTSVTSFEKILLDGLFTKIDTFTVKKTTKLSSVTKKALDDIYETLVQEGFFPHNPESIRTYYKNLSGFAGVTFNIPLVLSALLFGQAMPRKTLFGAKAAQVSKGLKGFLSSQERQLTFQADHQMFFEKLLPFAIAFGVEKIWAKRFKDLHIKEPRWFHSSSGSFSPDTFVDTVGSSTSPITTFTSRRSSGASGFSSGFSSGRGFSGGARGGGGGGTW